MVKYQFTIYGAPRTKKNSQVLARPGKGRPIPLPSKAWKKWLDTCEVYAPPGVALPDALTGRPLNCAARFFLQRRTGDAVGYYQGLADLLEKKGLVENDKWIVTWRGTDLYYDKRQPRVEVELTELHRELYLKTNPV